MPSDSTLAAVASVNLGLMVARSPEVTPNVTSKNLFLSTGFVLLTGFFGFVTTLFDAGATTLKPWIGAAGATDIAATTTTLANYPVGSHLTITGVFATAVTQTATKIPISIATMHGELINKILWPGGMNLGITTAAANNVTGQIQWVCFYIPVQPGAAVLAV
jgi:hypothetical protein